MNKSIFVKTLVTLIAFLSASITFHQATASVKVNTFKPQGKKKVPANNPAWGSSGKIKFKIAKNQGRLIAQNQRNRNRNSETYIVGGRVVDPNSVTLDKARFAASDVEEITNENFPQIIESFDYPNADIIEVTKAISELTGKNFIIDPNVRGKVNIIAPTKITVAEAYKAFLSALSMTGFAIVPAGPFLKIRGTRNAQRDNIETYSGEYYPDFDQMITRIIHLKHISADEVSKTLRILPSKDGELTPYPQTNSLIITDFGGNINRVMKIIERLDVPGFEETMAVIPVQHAVAKDLADLIVQIITKGEGLKKKGRRGSFSSSVPRFGKNRGGSSEVISMAAPDERTNSIIVVGNQAGIGRIRRLVRQLDFRLSPEEAGGVRVYYVKNGEAEKIAETLNGLATASTKQQTTRRGSNNTPAAAKTEPIFGGDVKIVADKATNSLVITANKSDYQTVIALLRKIDIPRDQVFVKAVIMEMDASDSNTFGVSYFKFDPDTDGTGRVGFNSGNLNSLLDVTSEGAILGFGSGETFDISVGGTTTTVSSFATFLQLLKVHTQSNILSTPQVLALSNEKSVIEVGDEIPVGSTTTQNGNSTQTSIDREKATVKLEVTPFISPDSDMVRMKILQIARSVSQQAVQASQLAEVSVALADRSIDTNIVVKSGDTAVLGGLIRTEFQEEVKKVPILGDIPILGWLFKSTSKTKKKNNLLVFITPKILRNSDDAKQIFRSKLDERIEFIQEHFNGRDPFGKQMDELAGTSLQDQENDIIDETLTE